MSETAKTNTASSIKTLINLMDTSDEAWVPYLNVQEFLDFINPVAPDLVLEKRETEVFIRPLPFYKETKLIKVHNEYPDEDPISIFYLKQGEDIVVLNGLSDHILEMNDSGDLNLNEKNVFDYLKFFAVFIDSEEEQEPFYVIENEQSEFLKYSSPYERQRATRKFPETTVKAEQDGQVFKITTRILFCNYAFDATFRITNDGEVVMEEDIEIGSL